MGGGAPLPTYMQSPAAAPFVPKATPTPTSNVNPYVASVTGTTGSYVPGVSGDGPTDYNPFINATVGAPPGAANPTTPVYGAGGGPGPGVVPATTPVQTSPFDTDPGYANAHATEQLGIPSINTNLNNLIAQRIVAYGDPSLAGQAGFGLDPQAAAFARQNYLSGNGQLARLDKAHTQARQAIINQLAAHGLIDSGDTGYQIGNADQTYGNTVYDAQQQALADILGYRNDAQSQLSSLHQQTISALENAFTNYANNPAAYGQTSATPAPVQQIAAVAKPKAVPKAVTKVLVNPYTTGQKRFG